jgi:hypothetical protein
VNSIAALGNGYGFFGTPGKPHAKFVVLAKYADIEAGAVFSAQNGIAGVLFPSTGGTWGSYRSQTAGGAGEAGNSQPDKKFAAIDHSEIHWGVVSVDLR